MSFLKAIELAENQDPAVVAIQKGIDIRHPGSPDFWDDFTRICANPEALAALLDVSRDKVASWPQKIKTMRANLPNNGDYNKMINTG